MKEKSRSLAGERLDEVVSIITDQDNIEHADAFGKSERDRPLIFHSTVDQERIERLGLSDIKHKTMARVVNAIATDAMVAHAAGKRVSYSRNRNLYSDGRYRAVPFTYKSVTDAVDILGGRGLIGELRARPGDHRRTGLQSRLWASPLMVSLWGRLDANISHDPYQTIRMKDADGNLISYEESDERRRMRRDMDAIGEALSSADIVLDAPDVEWNPFVVRVPTAKGEVLIMPSRKAPYRVFNNDNWQHGGRLYGLFVQGLPKERRAQLLINGRPVVEHDYSQLHPRLLYAEFGRQLDGKAYEVPGHEHQRDLLKVAWQIMINADGKRSGVAALAQHMAEKEGDRSVAGKFQRAAADVLELLEARHEPVRDAFYSGIGLRLQRVDSDMCVRVQKGNLKKGIIAPSVHDSYVVPEGRDADLVQEAMDDELNRQLARASNSAKPCPVRLPAHSILHMGETLLGSGPVEAETGTPGTACGTAANDDAPADDGRAVASASGLPVGRLIEAIEEAFGSGRPSKPVQLSLLDLLQDNWAPEQSALSDLQAYRGGLLPASLILLARDRRRALGMKQEEMARALGISRPQLANAEQRRFGLGHGPAARLREVLSVAA